MGAPLDVACRSSLLLQSAQTLSTTLLGFEFLQRPQHVLSNLLDQPHASVWVGSSTIAFSSAFPWALSLAFSIVSALCLPIGNSLLLGLLVGMGGEVGLLVFLIYLAIPVAPCRSRPSNRHAVICTRGTRAAGSRSSAVPCGSWSSGPGGSTWTCPAHAPSYRALPTRRCGLLLDPLGWLRSRDLGRFHSLPPRCRPCPT